MNDRHGVFVSYYHEQDQKYRDLFEKLFSDVYDIMESKSVEIGNIDPNIKTETVYQKIRDEHLRHSTVTVVLIGAKTWQRKYVDWEISSSLRDTKSNSRSGLIGILLPTYPASADVYERLAIEYIRPVSQITKTFRYNLYTIPPRLYDNLDDNPDRSYATLHKWSENPSEVQRWIQNAYRKRKSKTILPNNSRKLFAKNRKGEGWSE
ncbi:hypothetical protein F4225_11410 [Candidatus Poribacteria bacterium]|nr:hypothetical protein [Candidatus Poribacteria bacterium]